MTPLESHRRDHAWLLAQAKQLLGAADVVAIDADDFLSPLVKNSVRGPIHALGEILVRDWDRANRRTWHGVQFGARIYECEGVRFCRIHSPFAEYEYSSTTSFLVVARHQYARLYRIALQAKRAQEPAFEPVLAEETLTALRRNTVDYLTASNLSRIRAYGGRPKRGLLLSGPPGNGKTSACRWVRQLCARRGLDTKTVTPDAYRAARSSDDPVSAIRDLFNVDRSGVVFFDDFDAALADRAAANGSDDQAVFLGALDGMEVTTGVAHVFTTNLPLHRIDPAFRRPGRLDVVLSFPKPDEKLRRTLIERWHPDLLAALDVSQMVHDTEGYSFAEVDELKNLLVLRFTESETWDWAWAREQFQSGRGGLTSKPTRVGFGSVRNGTE